MLLVIASLSGAMSRLAGRPAPFLRLGVDARAQAMGNAQISSLSRDLTPCFWNPAASAQFKDWTFSTGYRLMTLDRRTGFLGFTRPIKPRLGLSMGIFYAGDKHIPIYDTDEELLGRGYFSAVTFSLNTSIKLSKKMAVGANIKLYSAKIQEGKEYVESKLSPTGSVDLGVHYRITEKLSIGGGIFNLGTFWEWSVPISDYSEYEYLARDTIPINLKFGTEYKATVLNRSLIVNADAEVFVIPRLAPDTSNYYRMLGMVHLGGEFSITDHFKVRTGINGLDHTALSELRPCAGIGFSDIGTNSRNNFNYSVVWETNYSGFNHSLSWVFHH
jgi:hypothetical protein